MYINFLAIARAVKEWEVKKAQGEIRESSDEGEEEEDIYAKAAAEVIIDIVVNLYIVAFSVGRRRR